MEGRTHLLTEAGFTALASQSAGLDRIAERYAPVALVELREHFHESSSLARCRTRPHDDDIALIAHAKASGRFDAIRLWSTNDETAHAAIGVVSPSDGEAMYFYITGWGDLSRLKHLSRFGDLGESVSVIDTVAVVEDRLGALKSIGMTVRSALEMIEAAMGLAPLDKYERPLIDELYPDTSQNIAHFKGDVPDESLVQIAAAKDRLPIAGVSTLKGLDLRKMSDSDSYAVVALVSLPEETTAMYLITQWGEEVPSRDQLQEWAWRRVIRQWRQQYRRALMAPVIEYRLPLVFAGASLPCWAMLGADNEWGYGGIVALVAGGGATMATRTALKMPQTARWARIFGAVLGLEMLLGAVHLVAADGHIFTREDRITALKGHWEQRTRTEEACGTRQRSGSSYGSSRKMITLQGKPGGPGGGRPHGPQRRTCSGTSQKVQYSVAVIATPKGVRIFETERASKFGQILSGIMARPGTYELSGPVFSLEPTTARRLS